MTTDEETPRQAIGPGEAPKAHPYRERYFIPFIFPLMIVIAVVFFVLNVGAHQRHDLFGENIDGFLDESR